MKKILIIAAIALTSGAAAQTHELSTKRILSMGHILNWKHDFQLYGDSLVKNLTGGFMSGKSPKREVWLAEQYIQEVGDVTQLRYRNLNFDIIVTLTKNKKRQSVKVRYKDDFSGQITEQFYY